MLYDSRRLLLSLAGLFCSCLFDNGIGFGRVHASSPQLVLTSASAIHTTDTEQQLLSAERDASVPSFQQYNYAPGTYDFAAGLTLLYDETIVGTSDITYGQEICESIPNCLLVWGRTHSDVLLFFAADPQDNTPTTFTVNSNDQMAWRYDAPVGASCSSSTDRFETNGLCVCGGFGSTLIEIDGIAELQDSPYGCKDAFHPRGGFTRVADYTKRAKISKRTPKSTKSGRTAKSLKARSLSYMSNPLVVPGARYRAKSAGIL